MQDSAWPSVDLKFAPQLEASRHQLHAVWEGFAAALALALTASTQADAPLPSVPVWADEIRALRGHQAQPASAAAVGAAPGEADAAAGTGAGASASASAGAARSAKPKRDTA